MSAKWYWRTDSTEPRAVVYLHWKKRLYTRTWCDDGLPIADRLRADRICNEINADLERCIRAGRPESFQPQRWFKIRKNELHYSVYADAWLKKAISSGRYAPGTLPGLIRFIEYTKDHFGSVDIREIKKRHVVDFTDSLSSGWSTGYKETCRRWLMVVLHAAEDEYEDIVTCPRSKSLKVPDTEIRWLTPEWQARIVDCLPTQKDKDIVNLLCSWGPRPSEGRALMWDCINWEQRCVVIRRTFSGPGIDHLKETKTGAIRYLPFDSPFVDLEKTFTRLRGDRESPEGFVFINPWGRPYHSKVDQVWNQAVKDARYFQHVTLVQGTRHSFATQNCDRLKDVQTIFGHTTEKMTERYIKAGMKQVMEFTRARERFRPFVHEVLTGNAEKRVITTK